MVEEMLAVVTVVSLSTAVDWRLGRMWMRELGIAGYEMRGEAW